MQPIHDRMPVILAPADVERWLDASITDPTLVEDLLRPCPPEWLRLTALWMRPWRSGSRPRPPESLGQARDALQLLLHRLPLRTHLPQPQAPAYQDHG